MIWIETPTNPLMKIIDIAAIVDIVRKINLHCIVVVDSTIASPISQVLMRLFCQIELNKNIYI